MVHELEGLVKIRWKQHKQIMVHELEGLVKI